MPKASKSKSKHADFQKTKLKLGKGKQQANNATDTSFRSRTIALPQQSINKDNSARLVTSRNLGVTELAQQLRHFGAGVRKEAVNGIREILTLHPVLVHSAVAQLVPDLCRVIADDDQGVRRNLYSLLSWYLPQVPRSLLSPYLNALLLFTASALSHIYPEVRLDAVRVLDILVEIAPTTATAGWHNAISSFVQPVAATNSSSSSTAKPASGPHTASASDQTSHGERFMNCYLNLLGITRRSGANAHSERSAAQQKSSAITVTNLSPAAKLLILKSLNAFLRAAAGTGSSALVDAQDHSVAPALASTSHATATVSSNCPTWFFRSSFSDDADFETFSSLLRPDIRRRHSRTFAVAAPRGTEAAKAELGIAAEATAAPASKRQRRERVTTSAASDFLSSDLRRGALVDVAGTAGKGWGNGDLLSSLTRAAKLGDGDAGTTPADAELAPSLYLFSLLQPVMVATFLDTAPAAFRPDLDLQTTTAGRAGSTQQYTGLSVQAEIVSHLIALCITLWRASIASSASSVSASPIAATRAQTAELSSLLGHAATYFPFSQQGTSSASQSASTLSLKARTALTEMDLAFSELTALLALGLGPRALVSDARQSASKGKGKTRVNMAAQLDMVSTFISELLTTSATSLASNEAAGTVSLSAAGSPALDPATYESLLPTVWLLLNTPTNAVESNGALLDAVVSHFGRSGSSSKVKAIAFEFVARLCCLQSFGSYDAGVTRPASAGRFSVQEGGRARELLGRWIESLPKYLWESTSSASAYGHGSAEGASTPHKVLEFLRFLVVTSGQCEGRGGVRLSDKEVASLREKLIPYFSITHPVKKVTVAGPFAKLRTEEEQREALALVEWLGCGSTDAYGRTQSGEAVEDASLRLAEAVKWVTAKA